jgi:hypothetical protein
MSKTGFNAGSYRILPENIFPVEEGAVNGDFSVSMGWVKVDNGDLTPLSFKERSGLFHGKQPAQQKKTKTPKS